jgi:hypothetical protein
MSNVKLGITEQKTMDNELYLLDFKKNIGKLSFNKEINNLEFVEIIGNMDFDHCINYTKRDIYLKKHGKQLFKKIILHKERERKIQIKIKHEIEYVSNKKNNGNKFLNNLSNIIKNIFKWKIIVTINIVEYKYGSNFKENDNNYSNITIINHSTEVLSQEEIDMLLIAINSDDENK